MTYTTTSTLDHLVETFPIGQEVENFGSKAVVKGYHASALTREYTGDLILWDGHCKWIADPAKCVRIN